MKNPFDPKHRFLPAKKEKVRFYCFSSRIFPVTMKELVEVVEDEGLDMTQMAEDFWLGYQGETLNMKNHGFGCSYDRRLGLLYKGYWENGKRHGFGQSYHEYSNGELDYIGEWKNGKEHGQGINCRNAWDEREERWVIRKAYEGEWKQGKKHGYGVMFKRNGSVYYEGIWDYDEMRDEKKWFGKIRDEKKNGKEHGQGIMCRDYWDEREERWVKRRKMGNKKSI